MTYKITSLLRVTRALCLALILSVVVTSPSMARLEIVEVNSEGLGINMRDAILDAIKSAVSMVNGVEVASETSLQTVSVSAETNESTAYAASSAFAEQISTATKGVVESYDIISYEQNEQLGNNYVVQLAVKVSKYKESKQLKRLKMAVSGLYIHNDVTDKANADAVAADIQNDVIDYLTQTRRFAMLDRSNLSDTQAELNLIASPGMATKELARLGNRVGTDYLVVLTLRDLDKVRYEEKMRTNDRVKTSTVTIAEVGIRILDVPTSQIKFSDSLLIRGENSYRNLARQSGRKIGQLIQNAIYPARIVAMDGDTLTIGQGGKTIIRGEVYDLVQLGERLIDPYTKESIGFKEIHVGKVKIERVQSKQSTASIVELTISDTNMLTNYKFIIRPTRPDRSADLEKERANVTNAKSRLDELKKSFQGE